MENQGFGSLVFSLCPFPPVPTLTGAEGGRWSDAHFIAEISDLPQPLLLPPSRTVEGLRCWILG